MMKRVSVIIVNWNVAKSLERCLSSVWATKYPDLEVIVIDNASQVKLKVDKNIKFIQNSQNLGFPKAVNQGLKRSSGDYLLILNPDTRLPKDFFVQAIQFIKAHPDAAVFGPKFVNPDGTDQGSVFNEPSIFGSNQKYTPATVEEAFAVSGACLFLPKSTIAKIGYLTEEVFMYYEDLDYCRRIHKAGLKVYFSPDLVIIHEHGSSARQNPKTSDWRGELWKSSLWYNGTIKHYLMWLVSWVGQKLGVKS